MKRFVTLALLVVLTLAMSATAPAQAATLRVAASASPHVGAGVTHIDFAATSSKAVRLRVRIYRGRRLLRTVSTRRARKSATVAWNLRTTAGRTVAPGTYSYVLTATAGRLARTKRGRVTVPPPSPAPVPAPVPAPAPADRFFGAYVSGAPDSLAPLSALEAAVGAPLEVVHFYVAITEGFPTTRAAAVVGRGSMPFVTLEFWDYTNGVSQTAYSLKAISAGNWDAQIRAFARGAKANGATMLVRPLHEMNGNWYPWGGTVNGNAPADFAPAWRHIVDVFRAEGATNVQFVWSPNNDSVPTTAANAVAAYWPGESYVDRIAIDGYNFGSGFSWSAWRSFSDTFRSSYAAVTTLSTTKPIFIAETSCSQVGGSNEAWVADMFATIPVSFPRIGGVVWFDTVAETDWRIESDAAAIATFRTCLSSW